MLETKYSLDLWSSELEGVPAFLNRFLYLLLWG